LSFFLSCQTVHGVAHFFSEWPIVFTEPSFHGVAFPFSRNAKLFGELPYFSGSRQTVQGFAKLVREPFVQGGAKFTGGCQIYQGAAKLLRSCESSGSCQNLQGVVKLCQVVALHVEEGFICSVELPSAQKYGVARHHSKSCQA
jgi:hypothetical protein